ncbi:MAG: strawberry notch C-terminal domain-containing protein [Vulcanimicrobiaceae bacterium]
MLTIHLDTYSIDRVAEVTGRSQRVVRKMIDGHYSRIVQHRPPTASADDNNAFQDGAKDVLLFSEGAGGTGRDFHADKNRGNQKPRAHYLLQTGWRSDRAVQGLGRTNRTNQAHLPSWFLCETNAPGHKRFISSIARKIEALGAASRGQRDAAGAGLFSEADNLESEYGAMAVTALINNIRRHNHPMPYQTWLEQTNLPIWIDDDGKLKTHIDVARFLNQVLSCDLGENNDGPQDVLMNAFMEALNQQIAIAKQTGTYDHGVQTLRAERIEKLQEQTIHTDDDGITTQLVSLNVTQRTHKRHFGEVVQKMELSKKRFPNDTNGFFDDNGEIAAVYRLVDVTVKGTPTAAYTVAYPTHSYPVLGNAPRLGVPVHHADAEQQWNETLTTVSDTTIVAHHIVTGGLLSIYHHLPQEVAKIVAIITDDGERLLGRLLTSAEANALTSTLTDTALLNERDIVDAILDHRNTATFTGSWSLRSSRFSHENRIEIAIPVWEMQNARYKLQENGCDVERVNYTLRAFLPIDRDAAAEALKRVIHGRTLASLS